MIRHRNTEIDGNRQRRSMRTNITMRKRFHNILFLTAAVFILGTVLPLQAANAFYFYDDLGRLSRAVTNTGDAAVYSYDEVGNLLSIGRETTSPVPLVITGITPDIAFSGTSVPVTITGSNLLSTQDISTDTSGVKISKAIVTNTKITATLDVLKDVTPGIITIKVTTAFGTSTTPITAEKLTITPMIKTMQPGGTADFQLSLSSNASHDINIPLTSDDPTIIGVPPTVLISSGSSAASFTATALTEGTTVVRVADGAGLVSVYITQPFTGPATSLTQAVSVLIPSSKQEPIYGPYLSGPISVLLSEASQSSMINQGPYLTTPVSVLMSLTQAVQISEGPYLALPISVLMIPPQTAQLNEGPYLSSPVSIIKELAPVTSVNAGPYLSAPVSVNVEGQNSSTSTEIGPILSSPVSVQK